MPTYRISYTRTGRRPPIRRSGRRPRRNPVDRPELSRDDLEAWRKPDAYTDASDVGLGVIGIWYGPGGVEGETASEVEFSGHYIIDYTDYQYLPGLVDEVAPGEEFLKTTVSFDTEDLFAALRDVGIQRPRSNLALVRHAAAYGSQILSYWGGNEEYTDELPR